MEHIDLKDPAIKITRCHLPCVVCDKEKTKMCSKCRKVWYCSQECSMKDWKMHRNVCARKKSDKVVRFKCEEIIHSNIYKILVLFSFNKIVILESKKDVSCFINGQQLDWGRFQGFRKIKKKLHYAIYIENNCVKHIACIKMSQRLKNDIANILIN